MIPDAPHSRSYPISSIEPCYFASPLGFPGRDVCLFRSRTAPQHKDSDIPPLRAHVAALEDRVESRGASQPFQVETKNLRNLSEEAVLGEWTLMVRAPSAVSAALFTTNTEMDQPSIVEGVLYPSVLHP